jgi:hypothetical protein
MSTDLSDRTKLILQVILVLAIVGVAVAILVSAGIMQTPSESHLVTFEVNASGGYASITLEAGNENITEPKTVTAPWSKTLRIKSGTEVYLTAANPSASGEISCKITLDKVVWKKAQNNAPKNGVACAGIVP